MKDTSWEIEVSGYSNRACKLYNFEDIFMEYLNLGAEITVEDESDIVRLIYERICFMEATSFA